MPIHHTHSRKRAQHGHTPLTTCTCTAPAIRAKQVRRPLPTFPLLFPFLPSFLPSFTPVVHFTKDPVLQAVAGRLLLHLFFSFHHLPLPSPSPSSFLHHQLDSQTKTKTKTIPNLPFCSLLDRHNAIFSLTHNATAYTRFSLGSKQKPRRFPPMANYDPYDRDYSRRYVREERRDDPRYLDPRDSFNSKSHSTRELVPRAREDSDLSVEEVRRDFPPPSGRDIRRARSAGPDYYEEEYEYRRGYDPRYDRDHDRRSRRGPTSSYYDDDDRKHKSKGMSKNEKIIAAVAGAALAVTGKELYDRREAKEDGTEVQRNALSTAALAGVGALAAYQGAQFYNKQQAKKDQKANMILHHSRDGYYNDYYSDDDIGPKEKKGHKNFLENAIAATGLGAAVKALTGGSGDDHRSDTRSRRGGSPSSERSRSHGGHSGGTNKIQKAAMASLLAGATEAFRVAKEPGGWKGEKTKRILTAAAGAAAVDTATDDKGGKLGLAESVIGGLVGNRLLRGSRNDIEEDRKTGRSRSRSRARSKSRSGGGGGASGLAALATAGLGALGAKKAFDRSRSRSRSRRGRSESYSPSPDRRRHRSRSRSVVDKARNSLAKLGLGAGAGAGAAAADDYRRREQDDFSDRSGHRSRRYEDDMSEDDRRYGSNRDYYEDDRSHRSKPRERRRGGRSDYSSSESDLGDSDEDERRAKKMRDHRRH
ncbi:hypothetical protein LCI18_009371 [Fusarium solani-melongenae]|uniref:Uncharacterized protein n=1 Tax=Fusarium solani subsp. cucurbitae TaxID=2747967 RepID=A0ACD3ZC78_FUSSC|nr:hypothetical protein LCI18_009371 [Fusarium solani-melongenae]